MYIHIQYPPFQPMYRVRYGEPPSHVFAPRRSHGYHRGVREHEAATSSCSKGTGNHITVRSNLINGRQVLCYQCGSSYEGTTTPDTASDVDMIAAETDLSIVTHRLMAGSGLRLLMFREDWTYPGYVKLQLLDGCQPITDDNSQAAKHWDFDQRGRACITHQGGNTGPASALVDEDGTHLLDAVYARKSDGIPAFAAEWIRRQRSHGWPSKQQLDQMRTMGCMVVQAGFYKSPEKDIEWRLSFSLQERLLMESLNIYQHKVYILLKLIKKDILEKELQEESLSSYHCKTCVFYMAELTPAWMWTRDNLFDCVLECLRLILKWLRNRFCPSYFIKEQNLFEKEGFERFIEPLQSSVDQIIQSGHQFLYKLQSDHIEEILRSEDLMLYKRVSDIKCCTYYEILGASSGHQDVLLFLTAQLDTFQSVDRVSGHTPEETKTALRLVLPWIHLHIGMLYACRAITCSTRSDGKGLMKKVDSHFRLAKNTDFANVQFAQVAILFRFGKFEECFLLLNEMATRWSLERLIFCPCKGANRLISGAQIVNDSYPPMREMSATKLFRNYVSTCVVFLPSQTDIIPSPLQYEMFRSMGTVPGPREDKNAWFDWVVVDAKIYLTFMQYLVCSRLDRQPHWKIAMDNLAYLIENIPWHSIHHKETAFNLLGWIYLQEHRTEDALRCFIQSWQIRPQHNAAKFHVLNMYRTQAGEQHRDQAGRL